MKDLLLTIIIASYNNIEYITQTIDSILIQDYSNIEIIIADDSSNNFDKSKYINYIDKNKKMNISNIQIYTNEQNLGTVKNINKAIKMSKGQYIKLIAADDTLYDEKSLSILVENIKYTKYKVVVSNVDICDNNLEHIKLYKYDKIQYKNKNINLVKENDYDFYELLCRGNMISAPGVLFHKSVFDEYGLFDEKYKLLEDYPMWLKLARKGVKFKFIDEITAKYRFGVGMSTNNTINIFLEDDYKKCIEDEIIKYIDEISDYAYIKSKYNYLKGSGYARNDLFSKLMYVIKYTEDIFDKKMIKNYTYNKKSTQDIKKLKQIFENSTNFDIIDFKLNLEKYILYREKDKNNEK